MPGNQVWARNASLLILTVTKRTFDHNDSPNSCCVHDIGLTACQLVLQATEMGYATHQMAGIEADKIRETYGVPEGYDPVTGSPSAIPGTRIPSPTTSARWSLGARTRRPFDEWVFRRPLGPVRRLLTAGCLPGQACRDCPRLNAVLNDLGSEGCPTST